MLFGGSGRMDEAIQAQLILAALLLAILPITMVNIPAQIHILRLYFDRAPQPDPGPTVRHDLQIGVDGRAILDGVVCPDLIALRMGLDYITIDRNHSLTIRPHPELRYEQFLMVFAVTRRSNIQQLHLVTGNEAVPPPGASIALPPPPARRCDAHPPYLL